MTAQTLIEQTLALCHAAREAGLPVSQARAIDVFRTLAVIDWQHPDDYRIALRINLLASRDHEMLFERVFASYFGYREAEHDGGASMPRSELLRGNLDAGGRSNDVRLAADG